jgi:hypothetical protein
MQIERRLTRLDSLALLNQLPRQRRQPDPEILSELPPRPATRQRQPHSLTPKLRRRSDPSSHRTPPGSSVGALHFSRASPRWRPPVRRRFRPSAARQAASRPHSPSDRARYPASPATGAPQGEPRRGAPRPAQSTRHCVERLLLPPVLRFPPMTVIAVQMTKDTTATPSLGLFPSSSPVASPAAMEQSLRPRKPDPHTGMAAKRICRPTRFAFRIASRARVATLPRTAGAVCSARNHTERSRPMRDTSCLACAGPTRAMRSGRVEAAGRA